MIMDRISEHISYQEAIRSQEAIRRGIDNTPNEVQLKFMKEVAETCFEPLRKWYGKSLIVSSFFRSAALNKAIKGSKTSQHVLGKAIDIDTGDNKENLRLFEWAKANLVFDQLISEFGDEHGPSWVHISFDRGANRNQVLYIK
jgi:hypothetical protein